MMKTAILLLDTDIPSFTPKYGTFAQLAKELLVSSSSVDPSTIEIFTVNSEGQNYPRRQSFIEGEYSNLILTGSRSDAYSDEKWVKELKEFVAIIIKDTSTKLIGICFGHQIIGSVLGYDVVVNDNGWERGVYHVEIEDEKLRGPFLGKRSFEICEFHHDVVVPGKNSYDGVSIIGSTNRCAIQGFYEKSEKMKVLSFQGHPEFSNEIVQFFIDADLRAGRIEADEHRLRSEELRTVDSDGTFLGKVIAEFLS